MKTNFHTHTTFCDGKNTAEEIVLSAIKKEFDAIGFSGHGYTDYDLSYCMKDTKGYISEINRLKDKYGKEIEIYLGVEEDAFCPVNRQEFDYIIGSCHYFKIGGEYRAIDSSYDNFKECVELFCGNPINMAENYYGAFCDYIKRRKPDIVGHFDLITKYDEIDGFKFLKSNEYLSLSEKYIEDVSKSEVIFEVNTGAIARGYRASPYPNENLLHILKKKNANLILSADSHNVDTLDFNFKETRKYLRDFGFEYVYTINGGKFVKDYL